MKEPNERIISNTRMIQIVRSRPKPRYSLKCGLKELDRLVDGFRPGELIVITGYTKMGKSLLAKTMTKGFYDVGEFPLYFQYEEEVEQFLDSFPRMSEDLIFYLPDEIKFNNIDWLLAMVKQGIGKFAIKCVIIDHLHFLMDSRKLKTNPSLFIGDFVRDIKKFAIDNHLVIFLLCHTKKADASQKEDFTEGAIRDSGMIPALADSTIFVHREVKGEGITRTEESFIKVCNHRRTGVRNEVIEVRKDGKYLREI